MINKIVIFAIMMLIIIAPILPGENYQSRNYTYNDTILVVNNNSPMSKSIGSYFQFQRDISNVVYLNTIDGENINLSDFNYQIKEPIENYLISNHIENETNYIILTKGVPMKITDIQRSVDSELTMILSPDRIIRNGSKYINPYYAQNESFSRKNLVYIL